MSHVEIPEDSFPSDEEFDEEEEVDSESSSDVDAKLAEEDVFDEEFFKCYSALKKKDKDIYDEKTKFFSDNKPTSSSDKGVNKKPKVTLLEHEINLKHEEEAPKPAMSFYEKELDEIKKAIVEQSDSDDDDEILVVKEPKSKPNQVVQQFWKDPEKLTEEEKFLRDYIVNKRYLPKEDDGGHFSKNLDEIVEEATDEEEKLKVSTHHSDDKDFDKVARIPRNSTKTIRDLVEKQSKKEKRLKRLKKEKKREQAIKDLDCEDLVGDLPTKFQYVETEPEDYGLSAEELLMAKEEEIEEWIKLKEKAKKLGNTEERNDLELKKKILKSVYATEDPEPSTSAEQTTELEQKRKTKKRKRGLNHKKIVKTGVAPDRLLSYGLSKTRLKKSKLL